MEKRFYYKHTNEYFSFLLPTILMVGVLVWGIYGLLAVGPLARYKLACVAMPILILSSVIGLHNPTNVQLSDSSIIFQAFGLKHEYKWKDVESLKIRTYAMGNTLIVIGKPRVFGGRYWIKSQMDGYDELLQYLAEKSETLSKM